MYPKVSALAMSSQPDILIDKLQIPAEFARYDNVIEADVIAQLELWKADAQDALISRLPPRGRAPGSRRSESPTPLSGPILETR